MKAYRKPFLLTLIALLAALMLAACGGGGGGETATGGEGETTAPEEGAPSGDVTTVRYVLWDANQLPAYEACAAEFSQQNPNIVVEIEQLGWDDYWSGLQTGFVSGDAPDVFTNHLAKYPEFAEKGQIVDIQPWVERDNVPTDIYIGDLAELWTRDGKRYGLPKDWDTISIFYNQEMFEAAGVDPAVMNEWTWNPQDGGTFEEVIAQLTLDANGNNGLSPDFDPDNVVQYGFIHQGGGGPYGQTQWSWLAVANGWQHTDGLWADSYNYEDPALAEALDWYSGLHLDKGYAPPLADVSSLGANSLFAAGEGAMTSDGSWMINWYNDNSEFPVGFGKIPAGPEGRKSMFNGLADSIWIGSDVQDEAWEWVKFAASPTCEEIVGEFGVVFPAVQSGVEKALASFQEKGLEVSSFTEVALEDGATFLFPITDNASEVTSIMEPVMDSIMLGEVEPAEALQEADQRVDDAFN